jgi:hypothetical protein
MTPQITIRVSLEAVDVPLTAPLALVLDLVAWVAARPRTYAETMDAWRTSCPRLPVWEDANDNGLVAVVAGDGGVREDAVRVTDAGQDFLRRHRA